MNYAVNRPRFVDETLDGEALVMDMAKGSYYSCTGASAFAWNALVGGVTTPDLAAMLTDRYAVPAADAATDVDRYVATLVELEMLVPVDDATTPTVDRAALDALVPAGEYEGLGVERFTDLADLILLDPVHDVTEVGWPNAAPEH